MLEVAPRRQIAAESVRLAHDLLGGTAVLPEPGFLGQRLQLGDTTVLASRSKMPRGRPDPFGQVADGGRVHLVPDPQILEQDWPQLDESQGRLASGDDGVHAGTVAVVGTDAAVAVAIEGRGVTAAPTVTLAGDEIDERCFLGLLHGLPLCAGQGERGLGALTVPGARAAQNGGFWHSIRGQPLNAKRVISTGGDGPCPRWRLRASLTHFECARSGARRRLGLNRSPAGHAPDYVGAPVRK